MKGQLKNAPEFQVQIKPMSSVMPVTHNAIMILVSYTTDQISYKMCPIHNFTNTAITHMFLKLNTCVCLNNLVINIFSYYQNSTSEYSKLPPCGHLAITDTPLLRTAAKSPAGETYRRLTEINSRYYGLLLLRTPNRGPKGVRYNGS